MKKLLLITAVSLLTLNALSSQEKDSKENKEFNFGLLSGADLYNFTNSIATYGDYSTKNGKRFSEIIRRYLGFYIEKPI